jgi:hypothetical protein
MNTPVTGTPRVLLRLEGLSVLMAAVVGYQAIGAGWGFFAVLLLLPDLSLIAYAAGPRVGAVAYNAVHTYFGPAGLAAYAYVGDAPAVWPICLIWMAHIGMDRALGLGLKFSSAFGDTHLGAVGRIRSHSC